MTNNKKSKIMNPVAPVDFVIIAALEEEREAILSKLKDFEKLDKESEDVYTYYYSEVKSIRKDGSIYQIIVASPLNMGPLNATALAVALVNRWKPQYVILTGIACGVKGEVNYGDVIIATQVADYTLGKQEDGVRKVRWEVTPSGASLIDSANNIDSKWINQIKHARPISGNVEKIKGVIASGGDVISDDDVIKSYSESWPKLIGIEMESGGVATGIHQTIERPEFLMVKSVSDFGKDKHNPEVKPWRKYACHTAAAFVFGLIKSGPFQSSLLIKEKSKETKTEDEKKEAAERQWLYIQNHPINNIEILFFLKSSVGFKWFIDLFENIHISFSREKKGITLKEVLKKSPEPNKKETDRKSILPISSFWELYDQEEGYWCKRTKLDGHTLNLVAGYDAWIPWRFLNMSDITNLQDLAICKDIGISFPPQIFQAGLEEVILRIEGETFSFSVYISDETPLEYYHEMASSFHSFDAKGNIPMNFSMSFQGVQLLEMFHKQSMPGYKRIKKNEGFMMGQSGPKGNSISFFPSMPKGFNKTKESEAFSFTIPGRQEIDYKKIERELEKDIHNNKNIVESYIKLGDLFIIQGRFQEAINCLSKAPDKVKLNSDCYYVLGISYANIGRFQDALSNYQQGLLISPNDPKLLVNIGLIFQHIEEYEKALLNIEKAAQLEPSNDSFQYNLSKILALLDRTSEAIIPARNAVKLAPENVQNVLTLGFLLASTGQYDESLELYEKAIQLDSKSAEAYKYYAIVLGIKGELVRAIENFKQSIELKKDIDCYADLSRLLCDPGKWMEAESVIIDGLAIEPDHHGLLLYLGVTKANQGDFDEAIKQFEKANTIDPNDKTAGNLIKQVRNRIKKEVKYRQNKKITTANIVYKTFGGQWYIERYSQYQKWL